MVEVALREFYLLTSKTYTAVLLVVKELENKKPTPLHQILGHGT